MSPDTFDIVEEVVKTIQQRPDLLSLTPFALDCIAYASECQGSTASSSPTLSGTSRFPSPSLVSQGSDTSSTSEYAVSKYEKHWYYNGISDEGDHPHLLYRTGSQRYPFLEPTGRHTNPPIKSLRGVHGTPLNKVWSTVGPLVSQAVKKAVKICYSIDPARFIVHGEDKDTLGPVVLWVTVYPGSTSPDTAHQVSQDILEILKQNEAQDVEIEWHEGIVEKATGPSLLRVVGRDHATVNARHHLTAVLGIPIVTAERQQEDAQGTLGFFFHENCDRDGNPSSKVFAVSNHHVLRKKDDEKYEYKVAGAPRQHVRVGGLRHFLMRSSLILVGAPLAPTSTSVRLSNQSQTETSQDHVQEDIDQLRKTKQKLAEEREAMEVLEHFHKYLMAQWSDIRVRNIGHVHYSPSISIDKDEKFTEDWGTIELLEEKFKDQFRGNVADFGTALSSDRVTKMMYPWRPTFKYPENRQFRINGIVTQEELANPNFNSQDQSDFVVLKDGSATGLTVGRYAGIESFRADEHGTESRELAIYSYSKKSGPFSDKGGSGSLIFDGLGRMVGLLHSGRHKNGLTSTLVTYATPAWWVVARIKKKYRHADFNRTHW